MAPQLSILCCTYNRVAPPSYSSQFGVRLMVANVVLPLQLAPYVQQYHASQPLYLARQERVRLLVALVAVAHVGSKSMGGNVGTLNFHAMLLLTKRDC
mmetsp:Transcript_14950/g.37923  ORF Transcript_14950/g.37923 Transcript_14950/m.37923 type:complete len:98 (+) Transcript_14950:265-558(+)